MRALTALSALAMMAMPAMADQHSSADKLDGLIYETNTIRFGQAYLNLFEVDPATCAESCDGDVKCAVWVYKPVTTQSVAVCELKSMIGRASTRPGVISGLSNRIVPARLQSPELAGGPEANEDDLFLPAAAPTLKPTLTTTPFPQSRTVEADPVVTVTDPEPVFTIDPVPSPFDGRTATPADPDQVIVAPIDPPLRDKDEEPLIIFKDEADAR